MIEINLAERKPTGLIRNKRQSKVARIRRELFKTRLIDIMFEQDTFSLRISDKRLAELIGETSRTTRRYLDHLRKNGVIEIERGSHMHHEYGWCNSRILKLSKDHQIIENHRRKDEPKL